jgi:hypothetical protein
MKANQLDLRAAFFMFFTSDAKSNRKYLFILLFSGLDGRETLFIALLARCRLFPDAFRTAGVQCIDPRGGSLKMNSTPIATMPIAVPTMPVNRVAGASGSALSPGYKEAYNCDGRINPGRSRDRSSADDATGAIGATDIRPPDGSVGILHRHRSKVCLVGISP